MISTIITSGNNTVGEKHQCEDDDEDKMKMKMKILLQEVLLEIKSFGKLGRYHFFNWFSKKPFND